MLHYDVEIGVDDGKAKLREMFERNKHVTDIRAIDLLVIKVGVLHPMHKQPVPNKLAYVGCNFFLQK